MSDGQVEKEAVEQGMILTASRMQDLENRIMENLRRPLKLIMYSLLALFVLMVGGGYFLNNLNDTVNNTDNIVSEAVSPAARKAQAKVVTDLLNEVDCLDQRNLQRLVGNLADAGLTQLEKAKSIVEKRCELQRATTTTSAEVTTTTFLPTTTTES